MVLAVLAILPIREILGLRALLTWSQFRQLKFEVEI